MEIEVSDNFSVLKDWLNMLKAVNEEHTLLCSPEGMRVTTMDSSHVVMLNTSIGASLFDAYKVTGDSEKVTVNVQDVSKFLDRIGKDETVKLHTDTEKARFNINSRRAGFRRNFNVYLMEPYDEEAPQPKITFRARSRMLLKSLETAVKDAGLVSEQVRFTLNREAMKVMADGDKGAAESEWDKASDDILEIGGEEEASATFTLSYLSDIIKALKPLAEVVSIELSMDMPVKVEAECSENQVEATFYLAPLIGA